MLATHRLWRVVTRFAPPAAVAAFAASLFFIAQNQAPQAHLRASLSWTTLLLMTFVGWGSAAAYLVARDEDADLGLRAAWGMGIALAFGGVLLLLRAASPRTLGAFVALGIALLVAYMVARKATQPERLRRLVAEVRGSPWFFCGVLVVGGVLALQAVAAVYDVAQWGVSDDAPAYGVFPKQILEAGNFDQPFSFRRLSAYGGQSFLQAFFLLELRVPRLHLFDRGLCTAVVLLLVLGAPRDRLRVPRELLLLPLLVVATVENVRQNLASEMSGVVFILALYRTLRWAPLDRGAHGTGGAALLAVLGAGALTLRQNYAAPVIAILAVAYAVPFFRATEPLRKRGRYLREPALAMGIALVLLVPWAIAAQRACGSFLYPFIAGNYNAGIGFEGTSDALVRMKLYWYNVSHPLPIVSIHAFVLAAFIVRDDSYRRAMLALLIGGFVGFVALLQFAWPANPDDYKRYYFGFELALVCGVALTAFEQSDDDAPSERRTVTWPALLVVAACLWQLYTGLGVTQSTLGAAVVRLEAERKKPTVPAERDDDRVYVRLQTSIPDEVPMLVMLDEPYRLDFARNTIDIIDLPGVVSPRPGMPTTDPEALATYLTTRGIRYLAFVRKGVSKHLYNSSIWDVHLHGAGDIPQHKMARTTVDVMNEIDELAARRVHLFDEAGMVVLDLETHAP